MRIDEGHDVSLQFSDGSVHTTLDLLSSEFRKPAFDLIQPTG